MPRSTAEDVDGYLAEVVEPDRLTALVRIRELCRTELPEHEEVMAWGLPCYRPAGGEPEISFANQKQYISFYLMRPDIREAFEERLADQDMGKGCLRFRRTEKIDYELVRDLLRATAGTPGEAC
ncbi:iron chaperone [Streptomyces sp. NPDC020681]|uniref:iron chaperone n=1 Tax=Streptomyces sp. NPDC020681 TaxID=3365083 RepID=UPI00379858E9